MRLSLKHVHAQEPQWMKSYAYRRAEQTGVVDGPLQGYHREWYVVRPDKELAHGGRVKVGEPREGILWFDHRVFPSEEQLLLKLAELGAPRVPPVHSLDNSALVPGFVEGQPLSELSRSGKIVEERHLAQIISVFGDLADVRPGTVHGWKICGRAPESEKDSAHFLQSLIRFTKEEVYDSRIRKFHPLLEEFGVSGAAFGRGSWLMSEAARLTARPFCLLHADLHRANLIVDHQDRLWPIDWELAMLGDPVYELATHLHLMNYPPDQERDVIDRWRAMMSERLPRATDGMDDDLPRYSAYKRAQSVITDVVRRAVAIQQSKSPEERPEQLRRTAETIEDVLTRAAPHLGLTVPDHEAIKSAYSTFCLPDQG